MQLPLSVDDLGMFFAPAHADVAVALREAGGYVAGVEASGLVPPAHQAQADVAARTLGTQGEVSEATRDRAAVAALAHTGLFAHVVPGLGASSPHATATKVDCRAVCLVREMLGFVSPRADSILAVQGLGCHPVLLAGSAAQREALAPFARGEAVAAFALTEPEAGSDVASLAARLTPDGDGYRLRGRKRFISNIGVASHATVFATLDPALGSKGITAVWLPLDSQGVQQQTTPAAAPHPIGSLFFDDVWIPRTAVIGELGQGFRLAMQTLDAFRVTVGAAAVGMAQRAFVEAATHAATRVQFGKPLAEQPLVAAHLADMLLSIDSARLLTLRAAMQKDTAEHPVTAAVSLAKLGATEQCSAAIDRAVQVMGGQGVMHGHIVELLYRAIRPLRIYEGTSEIQRTIIGRAVAKAYTPVSSKQG